MGKVKAAIFPFREKVKYYFIIVLLQGAWKILSEFAGPYKIIMFYNIL